VAHRHTVTKGCPFDARRIEVASAGSVYVSDRWLYGWALASIGLGGASLVVPLYAVELGGGPVTLGILAAAAAAAGAPGALVVGRLADRTGHRRGYALGAVGVVAGGLAVVAGTGSIPVVIAANAAIWFAFAAATPVLTLLAVVGTPETEWSGRIARLNKWQGVGWALGLLVGFLVIVGGERVAGLDARTALRAVCLVCGSSAGAGWLVVARTLPADPGPGAGPAPRRLRRALRGAGRFGVRGAGFPFTPSRTDLRGLHPRRFVRRFTSGLAIYFAAVGLVFAGFGTFFAPLPAYLAGAGFGSDAVFGLYLALNVGAAVSFGAAATLVERYEVAIVHAGSLAVRGAALPLVVLAGGALAAAIPLFVLVGLTWAVIAVSAATLVTRLSPPIVRGEALGVYSALSTVASGVGSVAGGWLAAAGYARAFAVAAGLVFAGVAVVLVLRWRGGSGSASTERTVYSVDGTE
jgi:MFS family permease